jgi:hypothetical protein
LLASVESIDTTLGPRNHITNDTKADLEACRRGLLGPAIGLLAHGVNAGLSTLNPPPNPQSPGEVGSNFMKHVASEHLMYWKDYQQHIYVQVMVSPVKSA